MNDRRGLLIGLGVLLPLALLYVPTLTWVVDRWESPSGYYQHGWLLPPVALVLLWLRAGRDEFCSNFLDGFRNKLYEF